MEGRVKPGYYPEFPVERILEMFKVNDEPFDDFSMILSLVKLLSIEDLPNLIGKVYIRWDNEWNGR